ncbi:P-type conjugative transfer protein TrbJ [uncultured Erythrobacter sp.]|uniref:P-type conjugative transfer protein TrbJ n=1 Tax=uncultured Erythrobacter sp. TaxID=263913 RepID=UPI0026052915|nr:P-type conjugative transfer protein TrbJ [uncultured Erythrobacter sp.]
MTIRKRILSVTTVIAIGLSSLTIATGPAHAITVFDPANYSQNLLTAVRNLQQINNQITQLANEAQMLVNQANNLTSLPMSVAGDLRSSLGEVDGLIRSAHGIAYEIGEIDREYRRLFPEEYDAAVTGIEIVRNAREAWQLAREGFKHSLEVQAGVVAELRNDAVTLDGLIAESQGAVGNLQAVQAGNQLTALAAKQSMQLQSLLAASTRADALDRANDTAERERARARLARFVGDGRAYNR